jgi:hypothetical protein
MIIKHILFIITLFLNFNTSFAFETNSTNTFLDKNSLCSIGRLSEFCQTLAYTSTFSLINTKLNNIFLKDVSTRGLLKKMPYYILVNMVLCHGLLDSNFDANLLLLSIGMATFDNIVCQRYVKGSFVQRLENKLRKALGLPKNAEGEYQSSQINNLCSDISCGSAWHLCKKAMGF